jgi:hypothetical protein
MVKHLLITILSISFVGCKGQTNENSGSMTNQKDPIEVVKEREQKSMAKNYSEIGELISTFEFKVKTNNLKDFEDGFIPWADLETPTNDLPNLYNRDEIIIPNKQIKIVIDYPLTNQYEFIIKSDNGFTRGQLLSEIGKHYYSLYEEEEKTATTKTIPLDKRTTMYNRNETNGKYGIWGHDIADLDLSGISVYKNSNGEIIITLNIES